MVWEYPVNRIGWTGSSPPLQCRQDRRTQINGSSGCLAFRLVEPTVIVSPPHVYLRIQPVDIRPLQTQDLSLTHTRHHSKGEQGLEFLMSGIFNQGPNLLRFEEIHSFLFGDFRSLNIADWVMIAESLLHRIFEDDVQCPRKQTEGIL